MIKSVVSIIANDLASKNKVLSVENGSIFEYVSPMGENEKRINEVAEIIGNSVRTDLLVLKNKLYPEMEKYITLVDENLKNTKPEKRADKYYIKELNIPDIIKELKDQNYVTSSTNVADLPITTLSIDLVENWKDYLVHNNQVINSYMNQILNSYSDENLRLIWLKIFSNVSKSNDAIGNLLYSGIETIEELLIVWLLTTNLLKNKPSGIKVNSDTFDSVMETLRTNVANRISYIYNEYSENENLGMLIISVRNSDRYLKEGFVINVNKDVYNDFIEKGGNAEIVLGMVAGKHSYAYEKGLAKNILTQADEYKNSWNKFVTLSDTLDKLDEPKRYKISYSIALTKLYEQFPDDLKDIIKLDLDKAEELLLKHLDSKPDYELVEIDELALELFQYILVPQTNFGTYVTNMMGYKKMNPDLTTAQTASLATIDLILTYLLNHVSVNNFVL